MPISPEPRALGGAPLDGVRVYELSSGVAARTAGRACADLGAEVFRLDPVTTEGSPAAWLGSALQDADGLIIDRELDEFGIATLPDRNCPLVVLQFDPDLPSPATSARILHGTGQTSIDTRGTIPVAPPGNIPYIDAAMTGVFAFLAMRWAAPTRNADAPADDVLVIRIVTEGVELAHGRPDLTRAANEKVADERDPFLALFLRCADGEIAAHINRSYWSEWVQLIGRPELDQDSRFTAMDDLLDNQDEAVAEVEKWCGQRTRYEVEELCQSRGIPVGAVLRPDEVAADRQLVHREFVGADGRPALLPFLLSDGRRWRATARTVDRGPASEPVVSERVASS